MGNAMVMILRFVSVSRDGGRRQMRRRPCSGGILEQMVGEEIFETRERHGRAEMMEGGGSRKARNGEMGVVKALAKYRTTVWLYRTPRKNFSLPG